MKASFTHKLKKYRTKILFILSGFAVLVLFLQNIKSLRSTVKEVFHETKDDLVIVDNYILDDTLEFRLLNVGDKTIALRAAVITVDTTYKILEEGEGSVDFISATYGTPLDDSSKSYQTSIRLSQSIKPNETDRFAFKIQGGKIIRIDSSRGKKTYSSHYGNYFIQFKVGFLLNNTDELITSSPIIHYFHVTPISMRRPPSHSLYEEDVLFYNAYLQNRSTALRISKFKFYKSPSAVSAVEEILAK